MPLNLRHRDFANLLDFTPAEIKRPAAARA